MHTWSRENRRNVRITILFYFILMPNGGKRYVVRMITADQHKYNLVQTTITWEVLKTLVKSQRQKQRFKLFIKWHPHWSISKRIWQAAPQTGAWNIKAFHILPWGESERDDLRDLLGSPALSKWRDSISFCTRKKSKSFWKKSYWSQNGLNFNTWEIMWKGIVVIEPVRHLLWTD